MKILLVEDDENIRQLVKSFLEKNRYIVEEAEDGGKALDMFEIYDYDLIILDLNLPKKDGIEVTKHLRKSGNKTPIIMLTARSQIYNKVEGFEVGTDDYLTKPFELDELLIRIKALIRRSNGNIRKNYLFGNIQYTMGSNTVLNTSSGTTIDLTAKEMSLLEYFLLHQGEVISAETLLEHVWDREVDMFTSTVKTHIKNLRKKMDPGKKFLKTVKGKGYVLIQ